MLSLLSIDESLNDKVLILCLRKHLMGSDQTKAVRQHYTRFRKIIMHPYKKKYALVLREKRTKLVKRTQQIVTQNTDVHTVKPSKIKA